MNGLRPVQKHEGWLSTASAKPVQNTLVTPTRRPNIRPHRVLRPDTNVLETSHNANHTEAHISRGCWIPASQGPENHKSQHIRPPQQQIIRPNELWETICKTETQTLREIVYHATLSNIDPQISLQVLNMNRTRLHNELVQAEQARKADELRDKRDRKKIIDFDHHFRQIDSWVSNDPFERKACRISYGIYEKIMARIGKIEDKAMEDTTNFQSRCNALDTLRMIIDTIMQNKGGAMGIEIYGYTNTDCRIENLMLNILGCMTREERAELLTVKNGDGRLWFEDMERIDALRKLERVSFGDPTAPFKGISKVLECVYGEVASQAVGDDVEVKRECTEE